MKRPVPLQVLASATAGSYRLYIGRDYVSSAAPASSRSIFEKKPLAEIFTQPNDDGKAQTRGESKTAARLVPSQVRSGHRGIRSTGCWSKCASGCPLRCRAQVVIGPGPINDSKTLTAGSPLAHFDQHLSSECHDGRIVLG